MSDQLVRSLIADGAVRVVAAVTTDVARAAARRHGAVAGAAVALGRASTAGLLLATLTKGGERVTAQVAGDGPLGAVTADATDAGDVRAYLHHPSVLVAGGPARRVSLAAAVGRRGVVNVVRDLGLRERHTGQSPIVTGELDEDVEHYLRASEQIDSALGCEAVLADATEIGAAGGLLVQCMPGGAGAALVRETQHRLRTGRLYAALAAAAPDPATLVRAVLGDLARDLEVLGARPVRFHCPCTRERVADMLSLLGPTELATMIHEDGRAEVTCNFCNARYDITRPELESIRKHLSPGSRVPSN